MKVLLKKIPDGGLDVDKTIEPGEIGLENDESLKCLSPLHVRAHVERADEEVIVHVKVEGRYQLICARCLDPVEEDREDTFDLFFDVTPEMQLIEFADDIRQELVVTLSTVRLCRQDCGGICPGCGVNLNHEKCKCKPVTSNFISFNNSK